MWKAAAGTNITINKQQDDDDDWETDPDFVNDVTEQEQRWGSTTIEGSGRTAGAIDMEKLRRETEEADKLKKQKQLEEGPNASFGYGGKFGIEKDRMDQSAVGHDYMVKLEKHESQKDYSTGFGGKFGVQTDRVDKSAVSWDYKEKIEKHASQKDYTSGFGGKFGVQKDRQDKSAVGWDHIEKVEKHESQKDYVVGFGGKFGVQKDRQDKSAVGWDHHERPQVHESQVDHKKGFGGKFGVQTDRMDKSAAPFDDESDTKVGTTYTKVKPDIGAAKPSDLRAKFERMTSSDSNPSSTASSPAPKKSIHSKAAMFDTRNEEKQISTPEKVCKQLDASKTAFLSQTTEIKQTTVDKTPGQLDKSKITQFSLNSTMPTSNQKSNIQAELEQLKQMQQENKTTSDQPVEVFPEEPVYSNYNVMQSPTEDAAPNGGHITEDNIQEDPEEIVDTGLRATALYDYQAAADDEISFDPDDSITHIEMIDEGWWRGMCKGKYGLFPANYVQLEQ